VIEKIVKVGINNLVNIVTPFLLMVIILKRLDLDEYGTIIKYQSIAMVHFLIIEWGFYSYAKKKMSKLNKIKISVIQGEILLSKLLIYILSCLLIILLYYIKIIDKEYLYMILYPFFLSCNSPYYLIVQDRDLEAIIINLISKSFLIIGVVYFFTNKSDYLSLLTVSTFVGAVIYNRDIKFRLQKMRIFFRIKESKEIFFANFCGGFYTYSIPIILSFSFNNSQIAIYGVHEKVTSILKMIFQIVSNAVTPSEIRNNFANIKKWMLLSLGMSIFYAGLLYLLKEELQSLLNTVIYDNYLVLFFISSLLSGLVIFYSQTYFLHKYATNIYKNIVVISALLGVFLLLIVARLNSLSLVIGCVAFIELTILLWMKKKDYDLSYKPKH